MTTINTLDSEISKLPFIVNDDGRTLIYACVGSRKVSKKQQPRHLFLLSDMLLIARPSLFGRRLVYDFHARIDALIMKATDQAPSDAADPDSTLVNIIAMDSASVYDVIMPIVLFQKIEQSLASVMEQELQAHQKRVAESDFLPSSSSSFSFLELSKALLLSEIWYQKRVVDPLRIHFDYLSSSAVLDQTELIQLMGALPPLLESSELSFKKLSTSVQIDDHGGDLKEAIAESSNLIECVHSFLEPFCVAASSPPSLSSEAPSITPPPTDLNSLSRLSRSLVALLSIKSPNSTALEFARKKLTDDDAELSEEVKSYISARLAEEASAPVASVGENIERHQVFSVYALYASSLNDRLVLFDRLVERSVTFRAYLKSREAEREDDDVEAISSASLPLRQLLSLPRERLEFYGRNLPLLRRGLAGSASGKSAELAALLDDAVPQLESIVDSVVVQARRRQRRLSAAQASATTAAAVVSNLPFSFQIEDASLSIDTPVVETPKERLKRRLKELNEELEVPVKNKSDFRLREILRGELRLLEDSLLHLSNEASPVSKASPTPKRGGLQAHPDAIARRQGLQRSSSLDAASIKAMLRKSGGASKSRLANSAQKPEPESSLPSVSSSNASDVVLSTRRRSNSERSKENSLRSLSMSTRTSGSAIVRRPSALSASGNAETANVNELFTNLSVDLLELWSLHLKKEYAAVKEQMKRLSKAERQRFKQMVQVQKQQLRSGSDASAETSASPEKDQTARLVEENRMLHQENESLKETIMKLRLEIAELKS